MWSGILSDCIAVTATQKQSRGLRLQVPLTDNKEAVADLLAVLYSIPAGTHHSKVARLLAVDTKQVQEVLQLAY